MAMLEYWYVGMSALRRETCNIRFSSRVHIHDMVLKILDCALESAPPEDINEAAQKVLNGRKPNIEKMSSGNPCLSLPAEFADSCAQEKVQRTLSESR